MDSVSNFADSIAIAGPLLLGIVVAIGTGVWLVMRRR